MNTIDVKYLGNVRDLIGVAHSESVPVVVYDGFDEALVAMSPAVFERVLLEGAVVSAVDRTTYRL